MGVGVVQHLDKNADQGQKHTRSAACAEDAFFLSQGKKGENSQNTYAHKHTHTHTQDLQAVVTLSPARLREQRESFLYFCGEPGGAGRQVVE